jgi:hypothetical protein
MKSFYGFNLENMGFYLIILFGLTQKVSKKSRKYEIPALKASAPSTDFLANALSRLAGLLKFHFNCVLFIPFGHEARPFRASVERSHRRSEFTQLSPFLWFVSFLAKKEMNNTNIHFELNKALLKKVAFY